MKLVETPKHFKMRKLDLHLVLAGAAALDVF